MSIPIPIDLALRRYERLALRSNDVWQGGLVRLPMWVANPAGDHLPPLRPIGAMWTSRRTGLIHLDLPGEGEDATPALLLSTLFAFAHAHARHLGGRAARLEVADADLRDSLEQALVGTGTKVDLIDDIPALRAALRDLERHATERAGGRVALEGLLARADVSPERLRAFAEAAVCFHRARPWRQLANDDLIAVHAPEPPEAMAQFIVMGGGGQQFGLSFMASRDEFEALLEGDASLDRVNGVTFGAIDEMPFADVDAWQDLGLPVDGPHAYPVAGAFNADGTAERPNAHVLTFMEAMLRALAETTEDDLDAGRWQRRVTTADGDVEVSLSLPLLLEAESAPSGPGMGPGARERVGTRIGELLRSRSFASLDEANEYLESARQSGLLDDARDVSPPETPQARAQELAWQAMDAFGRLRIKRARQALALWEDCADAWCVLAESAPREEAVALHERAVEAGARAIGPATMHDGIGRFWSVSEARPYMRARLSLARALRDADRRDEAVVHYQDLLRLNPHDNQGARFELLPVLLELGRFEDAGRLLAGYPDDEGTFPFGRALWRFATEGDTVSARAALADAVAINRHVAGFLVAPSRAPVLDDEGVVGGPEEGAWIARELGAAFLEVPGAMDWLRRSARRAVTPHGRKRSAKRGRRRR